MKIQYKGKMASIERHGTDAVSVKIASKTGKVIEGGDKLAPSAKESEMTMEFVLRPATADDLRIGQTLVITIATTEDE